MWHDDSKVLSHRGTSTAEWGLANPLNNGLANTRSADVTTAPVPAIDRMMPDALHRLQRRSGAVFDCRAERFTLQ
jgi:hypothetical protein